MANVVLIAHAAIIANAAIMANGYLFSIIMANVANDNDQPSSPQEIKMHEPEAGTQVGRVWLLEVSGGCYCIFLHQHRIPVFDGASARKTGFDHCLLSQYIMGSCSCSGASVHAHFTCLSLLVFVVRDS